VVDDDLSISAHSKVQLQYIDAHLKRAGKTCQGVLWSQSACTAMAMDQDAWLKLGVHGTHDTP